MQFSFMDYGNKDFVRDHDGSCLIKEFSNWGMADCFIEDGGLDEYDWTNQGTKKICWDDDED